MFSQCYRCMLGRRRERTKNKVQNHVWSNFLVTRFILLIFIQIFILQIETIYLIVTRKLKLRLWYVFSSQVHTKITSFLIGQFEIQSVKILWYGTTIIFKLYATLWHGWQFGLRKTLYIRLKRSLSQMLETIYTKHSNYIYGAWVLPRVLSKIVTSNDSCV